MENKKVAFVTGGSRGIGKAIVEKLGEDGFTVAFSYVNSDEKAENFVKYLQNKGIEAFSVKCDVKDFEASRNAVSKINEKYGGIDVLVNNAAITRDKLFLRMKEEDFDDVIETNLKGVFNATKAVIKGMMKKRWGRIINISSLTGITGNPGQVNYSSSKAGVIGFTKTLAAEVGGHNITVNAVAPGFINTDMTSALPENIKEKLLSMVPMKSMGEPEDVANLVSFIASDRAGYITGQTISVDGGASSV